MKSGYENDPEQEAVGRKELIFLLEYNLGREKALDGRV